MRDWEHRFWMRWGGRQADYRGWWHSRFSIHLAENWMNIVYILSGRDQNTVSFTVYKPVIGHNHTSAADCCIHQMVCMRQVTVVQPYFTLWWRPIILHHPTFSLNLHLLWTCQIKQYLYVYFWSGQGTPKGLQEKSEVFLKEITVFFNQKLFSPLWPSWLWSC